MAFRVSNIQGNLSKQELIQRIQQILQDAERAQQARQMISGDKPPPAAQEQVADTRQTEGNVVREDRGRKEPFAGRRQRREGDSDDERPPDGEPGTGENIDITI